MYIFTVKIQMSQILTYSFFVSLNYPLNKYIFKEYMAFAIHRAR
jgi:hypothetical protein